MDIDDFLEFQTAAPDGDYEILFRDNNTVILRTYDMCIQYWERVSIHVHSVNNCIDIFTYEEYLEEQETEIHDNPAI